MKKFIIPICAAVLALASCNKPAGWSVEGNIKGLDEGSKIALQANNGSIWYLVDSLTIGKDGHFEYTNGEAATNDEFLRLTLPGQDAAIHFAVDSVDHVVVAADAATFGQGHKLSGAYLAEMFAAVDSTVASTSDMAALQRALVPYITNDNTGTVAFYTVSKSKGATPIFDANDAFGNRIYGAAAQVYAANAPADPRGVALKQAYFAGRKALGRSIPHSTTVVEVPETGLIDIVRYDGRGKRHSLAEVAPKNAVTLLSFSLLTADWSPEYNKMLNEIYTSGNGRVQIYQLAFDPNEVAWREASRNLPWISVWNAPTDGESVLMQYNVGALPMAYVINSRGEIVERITDARKMKSTVAKYL